MLNKAIIIGRLGRDPETNYLQSGNAVANFSVATSESWKDKNTGEKKEKTEWHRVVAWGRLAEICGEYLRKGSLVYIEGKIETREWEKDGEKKYTTEIIVREMKMLGGRSESSGGGQRQARSRQGAPSSQPQQQSFAGPNEYTGGNTDDDIPF